jgi:hypothetical protein
MRKAKINLILSIDFGGSLTKVIGKIDGEKKFNLNFSPEVIEIDGDVLEEYRQVELEQIEPENGIWVEFDQKYYAVGYLAKLKFLATLGLNRLKYELAIPKVLGVLWVVTQKFNLKNKFNLALACLLPPGEYADREKFKNELEKALADFNTPTGRMKVKLVKYNCKPEGAGVLMMHKLKRG